MCQILFMLRCLVFCHALVYECHGMSINFLKFTWHSILLCQVNLKNSIDIPRHRIYVREYTEDIYK